MKNERRNFQALSTLPIKRNKYVRPSFDRTEFQFSRVLIFCLNRNVNVWKKGQQNQKLIFYSFSSLVFPLFEHFSSSRTIYHFSYMSCNASLTIHLNVSIFNRLTYRVFELNTDEKVDSIVILTSGPNLRPFPVNFRMMTQFRNNMHSIVVEQMFASANQQTNTFMCEMFFRAF